MSAHLPPDDVAEDALDEALADQDADIGSSLRALLEPPEDMALRTTEVVNQAIQGRSALSLGLDLLGLGFWTARTILSEGPPPADGEEEGRSHGD